MKQLNQSKYKKFIVIIFLFILGCSPAISILIPLNDLPSPTGNFSIGTKILYWEDKDRQEWFTKNNIHDKRKLVIQVWYPTHSTSDIKYPYIDFPEARLGPIAKQIEMPKFLINHIKDVKTNSILNAPLHFDKNNIPIIIFSHGLGGMKGQNTILVEHLASLGYFVIALDHPYDANITVFNDGTTADFRSGTTYLEAQRGRKIEWTEKEFWDFRLPQIKTRSADIKYLIDKIIFEVENNNPFWSKLDINRIGIFGHSYGGATGVVSAYNDNRIDACVSLDGWNLPIPQNIIEDGLQIPFLYIGRPKWDSDLNYQKLDTLLARNRSFSKKMILENTKHFDYSDTPHISPLTKKFGLSGSISSDELLLILTDEISTFFEKYLDNNFRKTKTSNQYKE